MKIIEQFSVPSQLWKSSEPEGAVPQLEGEKQIQCEGLRSSDAAFDLFGRNTANSLLVLHHRPTARLLRNPALLRWCPDFPAACPNSPACPAQPLSYCLRQAAEAPVGCETRLSGPCCDPLPALSPDLLLVKQQHSSFSFCHCIPTCCGHWLSLSSFGRQNKQTKEMVSTNVITEQNLNVVTFAEQLISWGAVAEGPQQGVLRVMFSTALYTSKCWNSKTLFFMKPLQYWIIFCFRKQITQRWLLWPCRDFHFSCLLQEKKEEDALS